MSLTLQLPALQLILAPTASGKTEAAIAMLRVPRRELAIVLVPNADQLTALRARLGKPRAVRTMQFLTLARTILKRNGNVPKLLDSTARLWLVRDLLGEAHAAGELPTYTRVAHKPGFIAAVTALFGDLADSDIAPAVFAAAAQTLHDRELAAIYRRYIAFQEQRRLADLPRFLRLARDVLRSSGAMLAHVELVVADGFDEFTPLQRSLLAALAARVPQMVMTLSNDGQPRPALGRFQRTLADLHKNFDTQIVHLPPISDQRPTALQQIKNHLFDHGTPAAVHACDMVEVIEAADREREVRAVLRRVKQRLLAGTAPEAVAVLYRAVEPYTALLHEIAAEYAIPLLIEEGLPLSNASPIAALLHLLRLAPEGFPQRALMQVLRNPYVTNDEARLDAAHHSLSAHQIVSLARLGVIGGLTNWRAALDQWAALPADELPVDSAPLLSPPEAQTLRIAIDAFVAWVTPPERATVTAFVAWVQTRRAAITLASDGHAAFAARDAAALQRFDELLNGLARSALLLDDHRTTWAAFQASLESAVDTARYHVPTSDAIVVAPVLSARGRTFDHVVLLGLSEGEFPQPLAEPPIYSRSERRAWAERGLYLDAPNPADERTIFYEAVTRANCTLTLSRTRLDETGVPLHRSPYLRALLGLLDGVKRVVIRAGSVPAWDEAASNMERSLALAEQLNIPLVNDEQPTANNKGQQSTAYATFMHSYPVWRHIARARHVEWQREGIDACGPYEGAIHDAELAALLATHFGADYQWSASQLNDYLVCPFRFAAAHVLGLAPQTEPHMFLDHALRGQLYHAILAEAGIRWRSAGIALADAHHDAALGELAAAAHAVLDTAPERFAFTPSPFWEWEQTDMQRRLRNALHGFIQHGANIWADFAPAQVEQRFGGRKHPALAIATPTGIVQLQGRVDRIDQRDDGALAIVDYKSGSATQKLADTIEGRDLQLPIYVLAVEQMTANAGQHVEQAAFFHIGSGKPGPVLSGAALRASLDTARTQIATTISAVHNADFRVRPSGDCPTFCVFEAICRRNLRKRQSNHG